jgi:hypothetical protein
MDKSMVSPLRYSFLAYADLGSARIERLFLREEREEAIRFRRTGIAAVRALELPEIAAGVFSKGFLTDLRDILDAQSQRAYA